MNSLILKCKYKHFFSIFQVFVTFFFDNYLNNIVKTHLQFKIAIISHHFLLKYQFLGSWDVRKFYR